MKKLLYIFLGLSLIFGCDNSPNATTDWKKMKLKGNIKSIRSIKKIFNPKDDNTKGQIEVFNFNKLGYIEYIEKTEFLDNDEQKIAVETFSYDNKYFLTNKQTYYNSYYFQTKDKYEDIRTDVKYDSNKKEIERRTTCLSSSCYENHSDKTYISKKTIYDENDKIMKEEFFNSKNEMTKVIAYLDTFGYTNIKQTYWNRKKLFKDINSYNSKGNLTEQINTYFSDNPDIDDMIYRKTYNYDNKDNLTAEEVNMYESPYLPLSLYVYKYEYDDFDNWIQVIKSKSLIYEEPPSKKLIFANKREITYYDE